MLRVCDLVEMEIETSNDDMVLASGVWVGLRRALCSGSVGLDSTNEVVLRDIPGTEIVVAGMPVRNFGDFSGGVKFDDGKLRYDLIPFDSMEEVAKVYTTGAKKYAERNWEKGMSYSRMFAAMCRHLFAFWKREDVDEDGELHIAKVAWYALGLIAYRNRGVGVDDRPR